MKIIKTDWFPILLGLIILIIIGDNVISGPARQNSLSLIPGLNNAKNQWHPPDIYQIPETPEGDLIRYGRDLIANTSRYLGPRGKVAHISNGLNCQNCHLDAGARIYSNAMVDVSTVYPTFRPRSGIVESIEFRVNDCMMRSMNGQPLDSGGREMEAIVAYLKWLGNGMPKELATRPEWNLEDLPYLDRAADPAKGEIVFLNKCSTCHGTDGMGLPHADSSGYVYPPLWGPDSYNTGAGLYRLARFSSLVKTTMPFGVSHEFPQLTDEEAWDVAAFVNSQPRPEKFFAGDWPDLTKKSIDFPYGPYTDGFSEKQHKYGPFKPIVEARKAMKKK
jgi:thiosulfate dehydrogenase